MWLVPPCPGTAAEKSTMSDRRVKERTKFAELSGARCSATSMDMARSNLLSTSNDLFRSTAEKHSRGMARASAPKTQLPSYPWIVLTPFSLRTESQTDTRSASDINNWLDSRNQVKDM